MRLPKIDGYTRRDVHYGHSPFLGRLSCAWDAFRRIFLALRDGRSFAYVVYKDPMTDGKTTSVFHTHTPNELWALSERFNDHAADARRDMTEEEPKP